MRRTTLGLVVITLVGACSGKTLELAPTAPETSLPPMDAGVGASTGPGLSACPVPDAAASAANSGGPGPGDAALDALPEGGASGCGTGKILCQGACVEPTSATCSPTVTVVASNQDMPWGIAIGANGLYWTLNTGAGAVMWSGKNCDSPTQLISNQANLTTVAVDSTNVYWGSGSVLAREALDGGAITYIDQNGAVSIAQDAKNLYWITNATNGVSQAPKAGGTPVVLAENLTPSVNDVAVDATTVYWTGGQQGGTVSAIPIGGGVITVLASSQAYPAGIAVDSTNVYWADFLDGTVHSVPKAGGEVRTLTDQAGGDLFLTLDGSTLYWTSYTTGGVMKMPVSGGTPTMIATGQNQPVMVVVDELSAYWTNAGGGQVLRAPK